MLSKIYVDIYIEESVSSHYQQCVESFEKSVLGSDTNNYEATPLFKATVRLGEIIGGKVNINYNPNTYDAIVYPNTYDLKYKPKNI